MGEAGQPGTTPSLVLGPGTWGPGSQDDGELVADIGTFRTAEPVRGTVGRPLNSGLPDSGDLAALALCLVQHQRVGARC